MTKKGSSKPVAKPSMINKVDKIFPVKKGKGKGKGKGC